MDFYSDGGTRQVDCQIRWTVYCAGAVYFLDASLDRQDNYCYKCCTLDTERFCWRSERMNDKQQ